MKLRNLMYATLVACAFASCSSDEGNNKGVDGAEVNAKFAVQVKAPVLSKAIGGTNNDAGIQSLQVYVFNNGTLQAKGNGLVEGDRLENIAVTSGQKEVVVTANAESVFNAMTVNTSTIANLYEAPLSIEKEDNGALSMNSRTYTVQILAGKVNYLGYTNEEVAGDANGNTLVPNEGSLNGNAIKLYRNVGKVVLSELEVNTTGAQNVYPNAQLKVTGVFILHGNKLTKAVGGAEPWDATELIGGNQAWVNGVNNTTYADWVSTMQAWIAKDPVNNKPKQNYVESGYEANEAYYGGLAYAVYPAGNQPETIIKEGSSLETVDAFYAYENLNTTTRTLLVVRGKFGYGEAGYDLNSFPERYYSVAVGDPATMQGSPVLPEGGIDRTPINGVLRNIQYNISLTVKGPGYETPFGPDGSESTVLNAKVQVVPFGSVNQKVDIE